MFLIYKTHIILYYKYIHYDKNGICEGNGTRDGRTKQLRNLNSSQEN